MDVLKKTRGLARRQYTIAEAKFKGVLDQPEADVVEIQSSFEYAQSRADALFKIEDGIQELWAQEKSEDDEKWCAEFDTTESYRERWLRLKVIYQRFTSRSDNVLNNNKEEEKIKRRFQLPKIELRKFDGDIKNWVSFWGQFKKINDDEEIDNDDKFQYLFQATEEGSRARQLVESYPPSGDNYRKAVDQLKSRFARDEMLIENYVRNLLHLVLNKSNQSLRNLYDSIFTQLQVLDTLKVTSDKYAAMLFPLIESAVPIDILIAWERSAEKKDDNQLSGLMNFLKKEVESQERITLAQTFEKEKPKEATSACIIAATGSEEKKKVGVCVWCDKSTHCSVECYIPSKWSLEQRRERLRSKRACFICLIVGHNAKICKKYPKCLACQRRHTVLMCPSLKITSDNESKTTTLLCESTTCLMQTIMVRIVHNNKSVVVRALLDSGAQKSYIRQDVVNLLNLKPIDNCFLSHCVFGGINTNKCQYNLFEFILESLDGKYKSNMSALGKDIISGPLPRFNNNEFFSKLKELNITLSDIGNESTEVSLLIGTDFIGHLLTGSIVHLKGSLIAIDTKLGWTVQGPISVQSTYTMCGSYIVHFALPEMWDLECLGIKESLVVEEESTKNKEVMTFFRNSIRVNDDGRYEVRIPWKEGKELLGNNKELAIKRLHSTTKRLLSIGMIEDYNSVFNEWLEEGVIEVTEGDDNGHYLPHHAVIKLSSATTKIRPVSDAAAKDRNGYSLNYFIEKGINLIEMIPHLLNQFRVNNIGITADIRRAFLQIAIAPEDRKYVQFLWWKNNERKEMIAYRHTRVVFGLTCSPFLLAATLIYHLEQTPGHLKDIAEKLTRSFYVDNCVVSVNSKEECNEFINVSKQLLKLAHFDLRGWVTGPSSESQRISILGLMWETLGDYLYVNINFDGNCEIVTKRVVLSYAQRIFDPIGFTCPVSLVPKLILQKCWLLNYDWDKEISQELTKQFKTWLNCISLLTEIKIPRRLTSQNINSCTLSLHTFCDASKDAYAAAVYLRSVFHGEVHVQLVSAKSRVAPTKKMSIPRLELLAALIGVRLYLRVKDTLHTNEDFFWTDSAVTLTWIKSKSNWSVFVRNRVSEINSITKSSQWRHISGSVNPADLPSRGCNAKDLLSSCWWEGPAWLKRNEDEWPLTKFVVNEEDVNIERSKTYKCDSVMLNSDVELGTYFLQRLQYFSSYSKTVRMLAWVNRFVCNCRHNVDKLSRELDYDEFMLAENILFKIIQGSFKDKDVDKLNVELFMDSKGLLRVKSRLVLRSDSDDFKYPILLPGDNVIVQRLIYEKHRLLQHAGSATVLSNLREVYWIVNVRKWVKRAINDCMICKKLRCKRAEAPVAPLPNNRVKNAKAFEVTGTDLCGPLILKSGQKCWVVIFTCAVYRAVHLELTESLSTSSFILALRRFIARRGRASIIYSDNGSNFTGLNNLFRSLDWDELQRFSTVNRFEWKFNVPSAPWWGGFWERLIRILKGLLRRVLGKACLNYVELETLLCDCEATMNSRPLTYLSDDSENLIPLTPSRFLHDLVDNVVDDLDQIDRSSISVRFKYLQKLRSDLRARFRTEYLSKLVYQSSQSKKYNITVGDIVIVESDVKRQFWPLGIVCEVFEGVDGYVRTAKVKIKNGTFLSRPIQRLYPLELSLVDKGHLEQVLREDNTVVPSSENVKDGNTVVTDKVKVFTRSGRESKIPQRYL